MCRPPGCSPLSLLRLPTHRSRRRQSTVPASAVIEYAPDDAPSVAPASRTAPRTAAKSRAARLGLYDTEVAETPGTVRRSRRLAHE